MSEVRIPALAKVNLRLEVLGKRPDGFHELRTIFQTISLKDELRLRSTRKPGIEFRVRGNASLSSEPVEKKLAYRAVDGLRQELTERDRGGIELRKRLPAGRRLAVGASVAACARTGSRR